ncbi:MAG: efflux RND transporter permease subunit, partial [bacterium]
MFLSKISLKNPVFITMLTIALIAFGLVSVKTLGVDQFPEMDIPFATVSVIYPGADSEKVEDEIITTIEDAVGTISGIDELQSFSIDNAGFIVIRFSENVDSVTAVQDVRDKISTVKKELPDDAEEPVVEKFDMNTESIISLILKTPSGADEAEINDKADTLVKTPLQSVEGVGRVNMIGGREREIKILLNPFKTGQYNMSALNFFRIVASSMQEIPAGTIKMLDNNEEIGVSSDGKVSSVEEIMSLPLFKAGENTVELSDVAVVLPGLEKEESAAFRNISPAIAFEIIKQGDANVLKVANRIKEQLPEIEKNLPEGYSIEIAIDKTPFIENAVNGTVENIFAGALLAMLIIFLFLMNKRAALIVAVSLPTSIIGTFLFVKIMGFTLNMVTTLALSLCVGILTDDAIVVIETIFRHIKKGKGKIKACIDATKEVGLAVISSELALISVFGPITLISGLTGAIFKEFGITIVFAIIISVLVSFTVSPLLASVILKKEKRKNIVFRIFGMFIKKLERRYSRAVGWSLNHRAVILSAASLIFLSSLLLIPKIPTTFIPEMDMGRFTITMELP